MLSPLHLRTEDAASPPSCQLDQASRAAIAAPDTQKIILFWGIAKLEHLPLIRKEVRFAQILK
jgi:hypothetical protein